MITINDLRIRVLTIILWWTAPHVIQSVPDYNYLLLWTRVRFTRTIKNQTCADLLKNYSIINYYFDGRVIFRMKIRDYVTCFFFITVYFHFNIEWIKGFRCLIFITFLCIFYNRSKKCVMIFYNKKIRTPVMYKYTHIFIILYFNRR